MKKRTAFLGLALATIMAFSIVGTSEAQSTKYSKPPKEFSTGRVAPYPVVTYKPAKNRQGGPVIRGNRQKFVYEVRWFNPETGETKLIKKQTIIQRVKPVKRGWLRR